MTKRKSSNSPNVIDLSKALGERVVTSSMQLTNYDEFYGDLIRPPYEPKELLRIIEESSYLKQYIEAMATNIAKFGHGIRYKDDFDYSNEEDELIIKEAEEELEKLSRLYKYINPTEPFKKVIEKMVIDRESIGWGTIEILRDGKGDVSHIEHCKAANIRIVSPKKEEYNPVEYEVLEKDDSGTYTTQTYYKRFKKFVQIINGRRVYFKEFGDKRHMDAFTGKYLQNEPENPATEIAFFPIYNPTTSYGIPRWTGSIADIVGNRASELLNLQYFESGTMLPAAITVDNGQLTEESIETLREGKGIGNAFKLLVLETAGFEDETHYNIDSGNKINNVKTQIHKLADTMNQDGLFKEYQRNIKEKIRDNFRLPQIFTGEASSYNRATAEVAKEIAEEQVFESAREDISSSFNTIINNELGIKYVEMYFKGPDIGNVADKAKALDPFIKAGAVTPNMLLETLGELLNKDFEPFAEDYGDIPIEILKTLNNREIPSLNVEESIDKADRTEDNIVKMMDKIEEFLSHNDSEKDE